MIDEFVGYIGLSPKYGVSDSGLYVDSLPDISVSFFEKLVRGDESILDLWGEIEKRALVKFRTLFIREINKCHKLSNVKVCECLALSNKELLATSLWYLLGAETMYERATSSRMNTYTTLDRDKSKDIREVFMSDFERELSIAVSGIDIHNSSCVDVVDGRDIVTFANTIL